MVLLATRAQQTQTLGEETGVPSKRIKRKVANQKWKEKTQNRCYWREGELGLEGGGVGVGGS